MTRTRKQLKILTISPFGALWRARLLAVALSGIMRELNNHQLKLVGLNCGLKVTPTASLTAVDL